LEGDRTNAAPVAEETTAFKPEVLTLKAVLQPDFQPLQEQKLPSTPKENGPPSEETAVKTAEPVKNSNGMVAAKPPLMLMTSQSQEDKSPHAVQRLGLEHFDGGSFEQPIRVDAPRAKLARAEKTDISELFEVKSAFSPTPHFEAISGEVEIQPVRQIEPTSVIEGIRTHVELLNTSTQ
jgi:hypothetical protein